MVFRIKCSGVFDISLFVELKQYDKNTVMDINKSSKVTSVYSVTEIISVTLQFEKIHP